MDLSHFKGGKCLEMIYCGFYFLKTCSWLFSCSFQPFKTKFEKKTEIFPGGAAVCSTLAKLGNTNSTLQQQEVVCVGECGLFAFSVYTKQKCTHTLQPWALPPLCVPSSSCMARLSTLVSVPPSTNHSSARTPGLAVSVCLSVCVTSCTHLLLPSSRYGQEGRPEADAGVVQAGAGEERPGPLWVGTHDIVSKLL